MGILAIVLNLVVVAVSVDARVIAACYLFFGPINDLGYTFEHNRGRIAAHKFISENYESLQLESYYQENAFFMDHDEVIQNFIATGCRIIHATSPAFTGSILPYVPKYRNITFSLQNAWGFLSSPEPNLVIFGSRTHDSWYQAGVVAALESKKCIGMILAHDDVPELIAVANAFLIGVQSTKKTDVHLMTLGSWYSPDKVVFASRAIYESFGCDVIAQYSDSFVSANYAAANGILSINMHSKANQYVGDNVLTCIYSDWVSTYTQINEDVALGLPPRSNMIFPFGTAKLCDISPKARQTTFERVKLFADEEPVFNISDVDLKQNLALELLPGVFHHGQTGLPEELCTKPGYVAGFRGGQRTRIITECHRCPNNTADIKGECVSCDVPEAAVLDLCKPVPLIYREGSTDVVVIVVPVVVSFVVLSVAIGIAGFYFTGRSRRDLMFAPKDGNIVLAFTDIESSTTKWMQDPDAMAYALTIHHSIIRSAIKRYRAYEVKTVGDSFMIASDEMDKMLPLLKDCQEQFLKTNWPEEIGVVRVRMGVHTGSPDVVFDDVTKGFDYVGNDANIAARIESIAPPGGILVSQASVTTEMALKHGFTLEPWEDVLLRGMETKTKVVELVIPGVTARLRESVAENADVSSRTSSFVPSCKSSFFSGFAGEADMDNAMMYIQSFLMRLSAKDRKTVIKMVAKSYGMKVSNLSRVVSVMLRCLNRNHAWQINNNNGE